MPRTRRPNRSRAARLSADVESILDRLPAVERDVVTRRLGLHDGSPTTRAEVARATGLGATEVAEIEQRGLQRLREVVGADTARALLARVG